MIIKTPYGVSPTIDIAIGGASVDYSALNTLAIFLEENKHDMLLIGMAGLPARAVTEYRNKPVQLKYDTGAGYTDHFIGYVTEVRPVDMTVAGFINGSPFNDVTIVCLGVSYDMRGKKSRSWIGTKLSDVAEEFSRTYGFSMDCPSVPLLFDTMIQSDESDWQFLVRYSNIHGLSVSVHGTHLHIYDPYKAAGRQISYNKLFTATGSRGDTSPSPGKVTNFRGSFMDNHADGVYRDTIVAVQQPNGVSFDVTSREVFGVTSSPRFTDRVSTSAENYAEAERMIRAQSRTSYDYTANVECLGIAGCQPGGIVYLDNYTTDWDGLWYVNGVEHNIASGAFITKLCVSRNGVSELETPVQVARFVPAPESVFDTTWRTSRRLFNVY